ncbi:oxalate:formate antiporter-like [Littorina saxatilis]|uniref:oxalate:formate antiporter-like n=1 Tax=Littorina saxatilis TaxID=31220 RepID=UPI0038B60929
MPLMTPTNKEAETSFWEKAEKSYQTRPARDEKHRENYHPREVVRCRVFWTMWAVMTFTYMGTAIVTNLFKAYGQTFINDDHYLSLVASLSSVFNAAGRPFWGMMADRFGFRIVAVVAQCVLACLVATVFTCEVTDREMFCVWVCAMYLAMCGLLTLIPALVFTLFGPRYFNVNMGLMDSSGIFSSVITGSVAPILKEAFGWHGLFFVAFAVIFIGILLNLSLSINCNEGSIPRHMYTDLSLT